MKKFISKNANLRIILRPGLLPEPATGRLAVPSLYVKFENGIANVFKEEDIEMMLKHPGYNLDFIDADEVEKDPYADIRKESEPGHILTEINYGHPGKSIGSPVKAKFTPEQKAFMLESAKAMAMEMTKELAPEIAKEMLKSMSQKVVTEKTKEIPTEEAPMEIDPIDETSIDETLKTVTDDKTQFNCGCGFNSKSNAGLAAHKRKCSFEK